MKTIIKILAIIAVFFGSVLALAGCSEEQLSPAGNQYSLGLRGNGPGAQGPQKGQGICQTQDSCRNLPKEDLSEAERDILLFMVEEEKMAHDLYAAFYAQWQAPAFDRIRQSEQKHIESVSYLLDKYDLEHPGTSLPAGKFSITALQDLFKTLLDKGKTGIADAYASGALVEETDINDLQNALKGAIDNTDIKYVFTHLSKASGRHLKSFVTNLAAAGITYVPVVLRNEDYNTWLAVSNPGCNNGGNGQGIGLCPNQGNGQGIGLCPNQGNGPGKGTGPGRGMGRKRG